MAVFEWVIVASLCGIVAVPRLSEPRTQQKRKLSDPFALAIAVRQNPASLILLRVARIRESLARAVAWLNEKSAFMIVQYLVSSNDSPSSEESALVPTVLRECRLDAPASSALASGGRRRPETAFYGGPWERVPRGFLALYRVVEKNNMVTHMEVI